MFASVASRTLLVVLLNCVVGIGVVGIPDSCLAWQSTSLEDVAAGRADIVDLTWPLNAKNGYWPGEGYKPFELRTIATLEKDGVLSKAFSMPEHLGTHIDAPNHFEPNQPSVSELDPKLLIGPGVVIDISPRAEQDADTMLTPPRHC
jgi:hypothetical protein